MAINGDTALTHLHTIHSTYYDKTTTLSCCTAAAVFLCVGALIIILCGSLCLQMPNINVIRQVILPTIVPGVIAIGLSIPFIIKTVKGREEIRPQRKEMFRIMVTSLNDHKVAGMKRKERVRFLLINFLEWNKNNEKEKEVIKHRRSDPYQRSILTKLQKIMDNNKKIEDDQKEKREKTVEKIISAIEGALTCLYKSGNSVKV